MDRAVKALIAKINKDYGDETIVVASEINTEQIPRMTSGSLAIDVALGGGWPCNVWNEIIGLESHGKTAVALKTIAANQALDPNFTTVWAAAEEYDKSWAAKLGVDNSRVILIEDNGMETVFQSVNNFCATKAIDAVVIDSLPALEPEREADGTMFDFVPGVAAILIGKFFRTNRKAMKRSFVTSERPVLGICINQWREKIGVIHGDPRTTPGGKGKNYSFYTRVEVRRSDWIKVGAEYVGQEIKLVTIKNKSAPPRRDAVVDFYFEETDEHQQGDYDTFKETVNMAITLGVIKRRGSYYDFGDESWQGRPKMIAALRADEKVRQLVSEEVLAAGKRRRPTEDPEEDEPEPEPEPAKKKVTRKKKS